MTADIIRRGPTAVESRPSTQSAMYVLDDVPAPTDQMARRERVLGALVQPTRAWRRICLPGRSNQRTVLCSLPSADLPEIDEPVLYGIHHGPRPGSRCAGDYHGARLDRHGARRTACPATLRPSSSSILRSAGRSMEIISVLLAIER
jgi:hypothetical protein